jgi:hypothetical protein
MWDASAITAPTEPRCGLAPRSLQWHEVAAASAACDIPGHSLLGSAVDLVDYVINPDILTIVVSRVSFICTADLVGPILVSGAIVAGQLTSPARYSVRSRRQREPSLPG